MKSIKIFAAAGAIALLGMAGLSSCKTNNGPEGPENYNGETVKTQFSIAIPGSTGSENAPGIMRMPALNTQEAGTNFLGMDEIRLLPYTTTVTSNVSAKVTTSSNRLGSNIELADIDDDGLSGKSGSKDHYKIYSDVQIPLGTNHFLFYAHGKNDGASTVASKFAYGRLAIANLTDATPSSVTISLEKINASTPDDALLAIGNNLATYLTSIANTVYSPGGSDPDIAWESSSSFNPAYQSLYNAFISMKAGSSRSIQAMIQDLYTTLKPQSIAGNGLATAIMSSINNAAYVTSIADDAAGTITFAASVSGFPENINLPDGAVAVQWVTSPAKKFVMSTNADWNPAGEYANISDYTKYVYPACIYYYANSGLKTSTTEQQSHYSDYSYWNQILTGLYAGTTNIFVNNDTRSVAIQDSIQYGVARLATRVKANGSSLNDNGNKNSVDIGNLQINAVLVGGQGDVKFDFVPTADGSYIVYDKDFKGAPVTLGSSYSTVNSTLLLETKPETNVYMAVEFINNDKDFFGKDGKLIPLGTRFYLVAQLLAASATDSNLSAAGKSKCVFAQDFTTFADLSIANLSNAYNVVPDLRSPKLELGFSVDLAWKTGHTYEISFQ